MDHVTRATPLTGMIKKLPFDIACKHTKFDDGQTDIRQTDVVKFCVLAGYVKWFVIKVT